MRKSWNLENKYALVTGGSKGIGSAIVQEFLDLGATVLLLARSKEDIAKVLSADPSGRLSGLAGDVTDHDFRKEVRTWIEKQWGRLDVLVNNAGVNIRRPSREYSAEEYTRVLEVNLIAPFEFCRELVTLLEKSNSASIVNIASVAGLMDAGTGAPYGMSKAGLMQLSRSLAAEWAGRVRVNTISPWFTETPATKGILSDPEKSWKIIGRTPQRRVAKDEEMAAVAAFLAMDKSSYITGQNIVVDGGATISLL